VRTLPDPGVLDAIGADLAEVVGIALANSTVLDRFTGTAVLEAGQAAEIGTLGYVARASGLASDARRDHPFADVYDALEVPVASAGDVLARFSMRAAEVRASLRLLRHLLAEAEADAGPTVAPSPPSMEAGARRGHHGVGLVEGWRGTIAHRVELAPDGTLARVKVVDPSFFNWPALPVALADTIVPDFPLANKSFNLSYAGNDL
jgi:Ni,Fe-hydrogenase III large subunit